MIKRFLAVFIFAAGLLGWQGLPLCAAASHVRGSAAAGSGDATVMLQGFYWTSWKTSPW